MQLWRRFRFVVTVVLLSVAVALGAIPGQDVLLALFAVALAFVFAALAVASFAVGAAAVVRRSYVQAVLEGLFVVVVVATLLQPELFFAPLRRLSAYAQLAALHSRLGTSGGVSAIETGGFSSLSRGLAYDPTGEIRNAPGTQPAAWRSAVSGLPLSSKCWEASRLVGSYYSWSGNYACD